MSTKTEFPYRRGLLLLVAVVIVVVLIISLCMPPQPFVSPLATTFVTPIYLPLVFKNHRASPDTRFGIAEHTPEQAGLLGLANAYFIAGHWRLPATGDTAVFLHPTERIHESNFLLCSWSVADDWFYDEAGCRAWIQAHRGMIYVIGNELSSPACLGGDGDWIDTIQYARWYREARILIKSEDPGALVAPYAPVGGAGGLLMDVWASHLEQFGTLLEADFYPVHHYCTPGDDSAWCWTKLTHWIDWLEQHRGTCWDGPQDYWLTEWGLPAWSEPAPNAIAIMEGITPRLQSNDIGISQHAWWPSCNSGWPDQCTSLIQGEQVTELGATYLRLSLE